MASFRQRPDGRWRAVVRIKGYPHQYAHFRHEWQARAWADKIEKSMRMGSWVAPSSAHLMSLKEALRRYELEITPTKRGARKEKYLLHTLAELSIAGKPLSQIRPADVAAIRDKWLASLSPATVIKRLNTLSAVFKTARIEWGMEDLANPIEAIRKPTTPAGRSRRIEMVEPENEDDATDRRIAKDELDLIIAASESLLLRIAIQFSVETAIRRGELCKCRRDYVDLDARVLRLPADITKNGRPRDIPLSNSAIALIQGLPERADGMLLGVRPDSLTQAFWRALKRARTLYVEQCAKARQQPEPDLLVDLRWHDLRHEATSLLAAHLAIQDLMKVTGHKSTAMLERYYHPRAEDLARRLPLSIRRPSISTQAVES